MVFGGEDNGPKPGGARGASPLKRVKRGRNKDPWILRPVSPLSIGEGIDTKVYEHGEFVALPRQLGPGRSRSCQATGLTNRARHGCPT